MKPDKIKKVKDDLLNLLNKQREAIQNFETEIDIFQEDVERKASETIDKWWTLLVECDVKFPEGKSLRILLTGTLSKLAVYVNLVKLIEEQSKWKSIEKQKSTLPGSALFSLCLSNARETVTLWIKYSNLLIFSLA